MKVVVKREGSVFVSEVVEASGAAVGEEGEGVGYMARSEGDGVGGACGLVTLELVCCGSVRGTGAFGSGLEAGGGMLVLV